jgi:hypothetical protein
MKIEDGIENRSSILYLRLSFFVGNSASIIRHASKTLENLPEVELVKFQEGSVQNPDVQTLINPGSEALEAWKLFVSVAFQSSVTEASLLLRAI